MNLPQHSPLGASGASRWMKCPASVQLSLGIEDTESDHAALGSAAHALAERCLNKNEDAWQCVGMTFGGFTVDKDMADAVQVYLDAVRRVHPDRNQGNTWVERRFHCKMIHELFYGTSDLLHRDGRTLHVWDYKHGAGIVIEVENNPQLKYYGLGAMMELSLFGRVNEVVLHVAQPRGFHYSGPIRSWTITADELLDWGTKELVPAMNKALSSSETHSGQHCRFCPARSMGCPQILSDLEEFEPMAKAIAADKKAAPALTNEQLARFLDLRDVMKIAVKSAEETGFARLNQGAVVPGYQLVNKRANREWRPEGLKLMAKEFGDDAYTTPELKSPAEIDKLPGGEAFTAKYAFKPDTGLTIDRIGSGKKAVNRDTKSLFTDQTKTKKGGKR